MLENTVYILGHVRQGRESASRRKHRRRLRVAPDEVTYSTLINLAPDYAEGRRVLDEMIDDGVAPNEVTLTTLVKLAPSFQQGCDLAFFARDGRSWYTGRGFYSALFSLPIDHLSADELLAVWNGLPFSFDTALENPVRQSRRSRKQDEALGICRYFPWLPAAQKFFLERGEFCLPAMSGIGLSGDTNDDIHYAYGIALQQNKKWEDARYHLTVAMQIAIEPKRLLDIEKRLTEIATSRD